MKKLSLIICICIVGILVLGGCKKPADDAGPDLDKVYKVKFVGTVSAGSKITIAVLVWGVNNTSATGLSTTNWTKEMDLTERELRSFIDNPTKNIGFSIQADGKDTSSTAKIEIFVNGTSVKVANATGTSLSADATYIF